MLELNQMISPFLMTIIIPFFILICITKFIFSSSSKNTQDNHNQYPKDYPIIGSTLAFLSQPKDLLHWTADIIQSTHSTSFVLHRPLGRRQIFTVDPANVQHMLKTNFSNYIKGNTFSVPNRDLLGQGIFVVDGQDWKFQRQVASHEFNTKSLRNFIEQVVETEHETRLIPILADAAKNGTVLDLQDILKRFAFDNICRIAFGYDPEYLSPSLPQSSFAVAFEDATIISSSRFRTFFAPIWKLKRMLDLGSEKQLRIAVKEIKDLARTIVRQKKHEMETNNNNNHQNKDFDLLSRFLESGHNDEEFVTDIVISFILAGRDTTSAALTWFFWLLSNNPQVESQILNEIKNNHNGDHDQYRSVFEEAKSGMEYTHAAISESMRLYPPVPMDTKEAAADDIMPDGTKVKKGMRVTYHVYAMGRNEKIWGEDWAEYRPDRWLAQAQDEEEKRMRFVGRDAYSYPVFQAGPRVCLGKEFAFLQMKRIVAVVLGRFRVVPAVEDGFQPVYVQGFTAVMKGGLPVKIYERQHVGIL